MQQINITFSLKYKKHDGYYDPNRLKGQGLKKTFRHKFLYGS